MVKLAKVFGIPAVIHGTEKGLINQGYRKMGINITQTLGSFQFENKENLRNTAKNILNRQGASEQTMQKILDKTIFDSDGRIYSNSQLAIIKASSQMSINGSLKETLKYLKSHAAEKKTQKTPVLGEIWALFNEEKNDYEGELIDFEVDNSAENIFAAA